MNCPNCNYALSEFDKECPRCIKYPPPVPQTAPTTVLRPPTSPPSYAPNYQAQFQSTPFDGPDTTWAIIGFLIPLAGFIMYFVARRETPLKAQSALKGAWWSVGTNFCIAFFMVVVLTLLGGKIKDDFPQSTGQPGNSPDASSQSLTPPVQGGGLTSEESAYLAKVTEWEASLVKALDAIPPSGNSQVQIANFKATVDQVMAERWRVFPPTDFTAAHSLIGQGLSKMQSALIMSGIKDTRAEISDAANIFDSGMKNAYAVAKSKGAQ